MAKANEIDFRKAFSKFNSKTYEILETTLDEDLWFKIKYFYTSLGHLAEYLEVHSCPETIPYDLSLLFTRVGEALDSRRRHAIGRELEQLFPLRIHDFEGNYEYNYEDSLIITEDGTFERRDPCDSFAELIPAFWAVLETLPSCSDEERYKSRKTAALQVEYAKQLVDSHCSTEGSGFVVF